MKSNKEIYKSKGIIAILVMIAIIVTSALGMCSSYKIIDKSAKSKKVNYFNEYGFANLIAESSYALYYDSMKENENQSASDFLLDIKKNITEEADEYSSYIQEALNNNIDQFNRETLGWNNDANLKYYYYNTINNKTNTTLNENVKFENNNIDLSEVNKDKYQFYAVVNFDNNGNVDVSEINGGDKEVLKSNIECSLIDIRNEYDISNSDYEEGYYNIDIKPIKNMTFVYAVPKTITSYDNIRWGIENADISIYESMGAGGAFIIAGIVALIALIFPIKKAKSTILFRKISKIPFEVWIIIIGLAIAALGPLAGQIIKATLNGDLQVIFVEIIPSLIIPERIIWIFNFIIWLLSYSAVFFFVLVIKYVFNVGVIDYIKERTIFGMVIMLCVRIIKRTLDEITKVDLREKNNKLIIKLLAINAVILLIITSIWFFGIPVVILYSVILFFIIRKYVDKISEKYSKLREATSKIAEGNLDVKIEEDLGLFEPFKGDLEKIQCGFKKAVDEEVKSQRMKTDLISNVSHDLKTPLTAIITYADLLKDENLSDEKRKQYIETLDRKAQRLQVLIENLFEVSKATSGNITLNIENIDVVSLMKQTLFELEDKLEEASLLVRKNMPKEKVILPLDSQRTFRVFENLIINITKYAMPNTRVFIDIIENEDDVAIIMKNMAAEEITFNVDTIAERFVRGDESRNAEGSGLGLAIAKSFVELQGGTFNISVDGDLFKVKIVFVK
ncbi:sensor histidine kinase KdpD [uncultured Clostridium sp.]|uniref:sensor histidine kinase n=1 Tax=uncultured Clostridium sp. TaxID=59620 RepID=UPI0026736C14|nr:sensor histidine kinase [uncultured Clostridium sp.]MBS4973037.1 sensor histidine kinase [Clostridium celatum]